jgi:hypothetical protein
MVAPYLWPRASLAILDYNGRFNFLALCSQADTRVQGMPRLTRLQLKITVGLCSLFCFVSQAKSWEAEDDPASVPVAEESDQEQRGVNWGPLLWQSFFFTSVEQGFRLGTQNETRHALKGKFFDDWARSIGNLHGWADGDTFLTNYIGHPMQGAVSAYIFVQNDRRYKRAEFGRNREYWKSRLRATLFSFVYSQQFELGPYSEASIGNAQSYFPQWGFVDQAITPTVGLVWMIGEDSIDKYIVKRLEERTSNRWVKMVLRAGLNPSRSMANVMRLEVPWHRDTRPGVFGHSNAPMLAKSDPPPIKYMGLTGAVPAAVKPLPQDVEPKLSDLSPMLVPRFEFSTVYSYFQLAAGKSGSLSCNGGGATATYNLASWFGLTADVSGCKMISPGTNLSGDSTTYLIGPRFTLRKWRRWTPWAQVLVGGNKFAYEQYYPDRKPANLPPIDPGDYNPYHSLYTSQFQTNAFALAGGVGLDFVINRAFAIRAIDIEDVHTWARNLNGTHYPNNIRASTGVALRFGNW